MVDVQVMGLFGFKVALVFHIVGALCLFGAIATTVLCHIWLRRAPTTEQASLVARTLQRLPLYFKLSATAILASGLYLTYLDVSHGEDNLGWIAVSLIAFVGIAAIGEIHSVRLTRKLSHLLNKNAPLPKIRELANRSSFAWLVTEACIIVGILIVMIFQPNTLTAALTIIAAAVVGIELRPAMQHSKTPAA